MVQNKQKSNKINITALITCFMLIMVFVFGCVQYANAAKNLTVADVLSKYNGSSNMYIGSTQYNNTFGEVAFVDCLESFSGNICGYFYSDDKGSTSWGIVSDNPFVVHRVDKNGNFSEYIINSKSSVSSSDNRMYYSFTTATHNNILDYQTSILTFSNVNDAYNYIDTGEVNNPIYQPTVYDKSIPTPKNLEVYFDRKLNKPFNLGELCNPLKIKWAIPEDSDYSNYTLDVQIDVNYNKLNSISGIGTKPTVLQTGKVEFASCSATDRELNISSTYDGWTNLSEKYQSSIWGLTGNYFDLWLRYKDSSGNYGNWVKVTINPDNSSTVIKAGLFDNGTNTTINKGYEEISGDNGEHVSGDYDNYYVNTLDENISNNLTSLKNNYSNLVSFYKELFSFLPAEIWIILIGLVSTMVIIAIVMFVRG